METLTSPKWVALEGAAHLVRGGGGVGKDRRAEQNSIWKNVNFCFSKRYLCARPENFRVSDDSPASKKNKTRFLSEKIVYATREKKFLKSLAFSAKFYCDYRTQKK